MSEPLRFSLKHHGQLSSMELDKDGEYVLWESYDSVCETIAKTETERDTTDAVNYYLKGEIVRLKNLVEKKDREWMAGFNDYERLLKETSKMADWLDEQGNYGGITNEFRKLNVGKAK